MFEWKLNERKSYYVVAASLLYTHVVFPLRLLRNGAALSVGRTGAIDDVTITSVRVHLGHCGTVDHADDADAKVGSLQMQR